MNSQLSTHIAQCFAIILNVHKKKYSSIQCSRIEQYPHYIKGTIEKKTCKMEYGFSSTLELTCSWSIYCNPNCTTHYAGLSMYFCIAVWYKPQRQYHYHIRTESNFNSSYIRSMIAHILNESFMMVKKARNKSKDGIKLTYIHTLTHSHILNGENMLNSTLAAYYSLTLNE